MPRVALVIEPDNSRAAAYKNLVEAHGLTAVHARDGDEAVAAARVKQPVLVLTELALPRRDGFAVLKELRSVCVPPPAVVVISAFREMRDAAFQSRRELGITELLGTTSSFQVVNRAIAKALTGETPVPPTAYAPPAPKPIPAVREAGPVAGTPPDRERLQKIAAMELMQDSPDDVVLERIVKETATAFGVPTATLTLVLENKQWFKAHVGLGGKLKEERGSPRDWSFCSRVVEGAKPMIIADAALNPAFAQNPLVQDGTVRGYAGAPLVTPSGVSLGTLCIIDQKPLQLTAAQLESLTLLARRVAGELELRQQQRRNSEELKALHDALETKERSQAALSSAVGTLQAVLSGLPDGVLVLSPDRRIVYANDRLAELSGVPKSKLLRMTLDEWKQQNAALFDDPTEFLQKVDVLSEGPFAAHEEFEVQRPVRRVIRWIARPLQLAGGVGELCLYTDITAEWDFRHERERLAYQDALTGIANRRAMEEALVRESARMQRGGTPGAVVMFDLDRFKAVNDQFGHAVGDEVLRSFAQVLQAQARRTDLVGRFGGEEFLALLPDISVEGAAVFAERVLAAYRAITRPGIPPQTASAGVAALTADTDASIAAADSLLYEAKAAGRAQLKAQLK